MSRRTDNHHRAAAVCRAATGRESAHRAAVHLPHPDPDWRPALPEHGDGLTRRWRSNRHRPHPAEAAEPSGRADAADGPGPVVARDWLNSRLLGRPRLLGAAGAAHGSEIAMGGAFVTPRRGPCHAADASARRHG
ncbi:hypothetical protein [Streptomyces yangpuensis]|uniref:hypothetical protein n=1 Tax=Streptomyces yangpuensis TaxID=1648182 RepID=UPI003723EE0B